MGFASWAKHAHQLAGRHADTVTSGIDKAATAAKQKSPDKVGYIDKVAEVAKKTVVPK